MSDANLTTIAAVTETGLGVRNPATLFRDVRFTKESFNFEKETVSSAEIRADRQIADDVKVFGQTSGGYEFELSFLSFQMIAEAMMMNQWQTINITANIALNAGTQIASAAAGTFSAILIGSAVKLSGAANADNNGVKRVIGKATDGSAITFAPGSIVATASSASLTLTGKSIRNGVTRSSQAFEKRLVNAKGEDYFHRFTGMVADKLDLTIESKKIVTGSISFIGTAFETGNTSASTGATSPVYATGTLTATDNFTNNESVTVGNQVYVFKSSPTGAYDLAIGADASASLDNLIAAVNGDYNTPQNPLVSAAAGAGDTAVFTARYAGTAGNSVATTVNADDATFGGATLTGGVNPATSYTAAPSGPIVNGTSNFGRLYIDGGVAEDRFRSIKLTISNNARGKDALGSEGNFDVGLGTIGVEGSLDAYFRDNTLPEKIRDHTSFGLDFSIQDALGNRFFFYLPNIKPGNGPAKIDGINTDVMIATNIKAIYGDNPTGATIILDAFPA